MRDIKVLAQCGGNFRFYDEQFRMNRQTSHCEWDTVHSGLHFQATHFDEHKMSIENLRKSSEATVVRSIPSTAVIIFHE